MKPSNRKKRWMIGVIFILIGYLALLYFTNHIVASSASIENFNNFFPVVFQHIKEQPFVFLEFAELKPAFGVATFFYAIFVAFIWVEYLRRKQMRPGQESGSAAWNTDLRAYNKKYTAPHHKPYADRSGDDNNNIILTQDVFLSMDGRKTRRNLNTLVIGGSGSGKSRFVVKPNLLQANSSFVVTDPSGELLESTGEFLKKRGYKIKVFNLVQMQHSCSYNPFHYIRNEEGVLTMINALIRNTTPKGSQSNDPFWEKAETALLQAICFYLFYECEEEDRNFTNVMKLLRCLEVREGQENFDSTLDIMFKDLKATNPEHIAVRQYAVFKQAAGKTAMSIMVSCSVRLTVFNMDSITKLTSIDNINLETMGDEKTALFCITPVVDPTFNFLVALLYTQLFETLYFHAETQCKGKRLPVHVRFLLDEFANIGTIPDFEQKLSTMRKYEISCTIIIQALSQIKAMYEKEWEVIVGNCDELLFLGGSDATTLEYISKKLGKETIRTRNSTRNFGSKSGGSSESYNTTGRELMTPDEISYMDNEDCILFIRGIHPFFGKKYDYPKHPNYKYTGDANDANLFNVCKNFNTAAPSKLVVSEADDKKEKLKAQNRRSEQFNVAKVEKAHLNARKTVKQTSNNGLRLNTPDDIVPTLLFLAEQNRVGDEVKTFDQTTVFAGANLPAIEALSEYDDSAAIMNAVHAETDIEKNISG